MSDFEKYSGFKKSRYGSFYSVKTTYLAFLCFFKKHDFVMKISLRVRFWIEKNTKRQILNWKKDNASDFDLKKYSASDFELEKIQRDRFRNKICASCQIFNKKISLLNSNLVPPHVLFTSFSSIKPCTVTTYNIFVNKIIAFATVQTILLVLVFAGTLTFDFAMVSHFIPSLGLIYAETCCY